MNLSDTALRVGCQEPSRCHEPVGDDFHGGAAEIVARNYGLSLDVWQQRVVKTWLLEAEDGRWSSSTAGLSVPRQNGKNAALEVRELYGMTELGEKFLHTAHEVKTARKAFLRLAGFFENERRFPRLAGMVESIRKTNGQEAILLVNGGSIEFVARSKGSGRGYTVDTLVCDEAQHMTDEQLEALKSTTSAAPSGRSQTIYTGTPPKPEETAEVFPRIRQSGSVDLQERVAWHEWSVSPDADGNVDLDDRELWYQANPALGIRLNVQVLEDERVEFSDDGFLRERLGSWETSRSGAVIDPNVWGRLEDVKSKVDGPRVVFGVDMTPARDSASIVVAGHRSDDLTHVEQIASTRDGDWLPGTEWVVKRGVELVRKHRAEVAIDPASPAGSLIPRFQEAGVEPVLVSGREFGQACGNFVDVVSQGKLRHIGQPKLAVAVDAGRRRTMGDAWGWHRKDTSSDISPLVAGTLAVWVLGKPPKRKPRSGKAQFL